MQNNYTRLYSVSFLHTYYEDGYCKNLVFQLSEKTNAIFQKYNFKMIITNKGFEIYSTSNQSKIDLLNYIETTESINAFQFEFITNDPTFFYYTETPINEMIQYDLNSQDIIENSNDDSKHFTLNTRMLNDSSLLGSVTIHFNDIIKYYSEDKVLDFSAHFLARKTQWEYHIINSSNLEIGTLSIVNNSGIIFSDPVETVLTNGQEALTLRSEQLIALSEKPQYIFDLISRISQNNQKTIFIGLPNPNPSQFLFSNDHIVISPMYIYI